MVFDTPALPPGGAFRPRGRRHNPPMAPSSLRPSSTLPQTWPCFAPDEVQAVVRVLESGKVNYWTGTEGRDFEREWAQYVGTNHGLALMNGTVTMELALVALGIGPGDEVIITPRTFMATATAVMVRGAIPIFAEVDRDSGNITGESIAAKITKNTRAIIPVHLGGWPCDMDSLLGAANGIPVIEDCAQAHGAEWRGKRVGSMGLINSWSFCQDKIMTLGGEGGAITCDDEGLWKKMWSYKDHGKSFDAIYHRPHPPGFRWVNEGIGSNWRMTEMQAAIGRIQIGKLDDWVAKRQANCDQFDSLLASHPLLRVPKAPNHTKHACYRWYGYVEANQLKADWSRDRICAEMAKLAHFCQVGSCSEIYLEKAFDAAYRPAERLPIALELGETSLARQVHPTLQSETIQAVGRALRGILDQARR